MNTSNFINLIGRLGDNPKTKTLESGTTLTTFSLATNEYFRDRDGNRQTRTEWHRVIAFGKLAELFDQYLRRGEQVSIVGSMRYRKWTDKYEQARTSAEVVADSFSFIGTGNSPAENGTDRSANLVAAPVPATHRPLGKEMTVAETIGQDADQEIPF